MNRDRRWRRPDCPAGGCRSSTAADLQTADDVLAPLERNAGDFGMKVRRVADAGVADRRDTRPSLRETPLDKRILASSPTALTRGRSVGSSVAAVERATARSNAASDAVGGGSALRACCSSSPAVRRAPNGRVPVEAFEVELISSCPCSNAASCNPAFCASSGSTVFVSPEYGRPRRRSRRRFVALALVARRRGGRCAHARFGFLRGVRAGPQRYLRADARRGFARPPLRHASATSRCDLRPGPRGGVAPPPRADACGNPSTSGAE